MTNLVIYGLIACIMYLIFKKEENDWIIERSSDATIEVVGGKYILKEK